MNIRSATLTDIDSILKMTKACALYMMQNKIFQWNENYPNRKAFEHDISKKELFVLENNEEIVGSIVISTHMDEEYKSINWCTPDGNNAYIHRLAVHPKYQGKGYAQQLMTFAENHAIENNYASIRLDTFSRNKKNQKFYELRGYKKLGDVFFPKQSVYPFHCYELVF